MAKKIKVATTCRRCNSIPSNTSINHTDDTVIAYINEVLETVKERQPNLIVLPEMCDLPNGWDMDTYINYIENRTGIVYEYVVEKAHQMKAWIAFSTVRKIEDGSFRNSCILIDTTGNVQMIFDKLHPTLGELEIGILPGDEVKVLNCELGSIGASICFDLNYTDIAYEYKKHNLDLLLFPSLFSGGIQQQLWAYTTGAHLIGACGGCLATIVSPTGEILEKSTGYFLEVVYEINLDFALVHLDFNWDKIRALTNKYASIVTMHDPGGTGFVILTCESENHNMKEMLEEFEIEVLSNYLQRMEALTIQKMRGGKNHE